MSPVPPAPRRRRLNPGSGASVACSASAKIWYVTTTVADARGTAVPRRHDSIRFSVSGPAEIVAVDNGDPTSFEPFQASERKAFNGLALVVLRTRKGRGGPIRLRAEADGLKAAEAKLTSRP